MKTWLLKIVIALAAVVILAGGATWYVHRGGDAAAGFRTAPVKRGDVVATISATGTVEPEEVIDVGAQVAGQIQEFGKDKSGKTIDYGSTIEEGMMMAKIDDTVYAADVTQAKAQVAGAQAGVLRAQADLLQLKAKLDQAQRDWDRAQKLGPSDALAQASYDAYKSSFDQAKANVAVGEAAIVAAEASAQQAQAMLERAQRNLTYCTIKSPVNGVIIDRRVNAGQTVVSSLNAPSLFLIAKDLKRMEVWVAVNEADIGNVHEGQPVSFSVDAFPGERFRGTVNKVRLNASMTQNVVTYTVEVTTDNSSGRLLPYLTANAQFEVARREDVLTVPNAALRWTPRSDQLAPDVRDAYASAAGSGRRDRSAGSAADTTSPNATTRPSRRGDRATSGPSTRRAGGAEARQGVLWVRDGQYVRPLQVRVGATDGVVTEISGKDAQENIEVIIGEATAADSSAAAAPSTGNNPFAPQFPRGGRGGGGGGGRRGM